MKDWKNRKNGVHDILDVEDQNLGELELLYRSKKREIPFILSRKSAECLPVSRVESFPTWPRDLHLFLLEQNAIRRRAKNLLASD